MNSDAALIVVSALLGLYGNRIRGGLYRLPGGDLPARALGCIPFGLIAWAAAWPWPWALGLWWCGVIGASVAGSYGSYSMNDGGKEWLLMQFYGLERLVFVWGLLTWRSGLFSLWLLVPVLLCPLCYWLARFWPVSIRWLGIKSASGQNANGEDAGFGEALFGVLYGAAFGAILVQ